MVNSNVLPVSAAVTHVGSTLFVEETDGIVKVQFNREKDTNSFSRQMTLELTAVLQKLRPDTGALILTGGTGRSFSVGGDFNDVSKLSEESEIRTYLGEIIDLYIAVLRVECPVIAAIDKFAIGQGLQVALMSDWRLGARSCHTQMPELKNGVACPLGSIILEFLFGRAKMQELVFDCEMMDANASRAHGLLSQLCATEDLQSTAVTVAKKLAAYPRVPFATTKRIQNERFIAAFETVREASMKSHVAAILARAGKKHFDKILGRSE